jgi:hypothetical protein
MKKRKKTKSKPPYQKRVINQKKPVRFLQVEFGVDPWRSSGDRATEVRRRLDPDLLKFVGMLPKRLGDLTVWQMVENVTTEAGRGTPRQGAVVNEHHVLDLKKPFGEDFYVWPCIESKEGDLGFPPVVDDAPLKFYYRYGYGSELHRLNEKMEITVHHNYKTDEDGNVMNDLHFTKPQYLKRYKVSPEMYDMWVARKKLKSDYRRNLCRSLCRLVLKKKQPNLPTDVCHLIADYILEM